MHARENTHKMIDAFLRDGLLKTEVDIDNKHAVFVKWTLEEVSTSE